MATPAVRAGAIVMLMQQNRHILALKSEDSEESPCPCRHPNPVQPRSLHQPRALLLQFQRRVLAQAADPAMPLLERLRFLCIVSSNLDEFFEVRVAGVKEQMRLGSLTMTTDGLTPAALHALISREVHSIIAEQYALLNDTILPALAAEGIVFLRRSAWTDAQHLWARDYFMREVMPVLTPIGLDPAHPSRGCSTRASTSPSNSKAATPSGATPAPPSCRRPRALPRVIRVPKELTGVDDAFVFLSSLLHAHVGELFGGMNVLGCYQFRVTRNSDMFVDEEEVKDLRATLKGELQQRHFGDAVRLELADNCSEAMAGFLMKQFALDRADVYRVPGIVNLVRLNQVPDWVERPDLKYRSFRPARPKELAKGDNIFAAVRKQDILLHHPFQSFEPVIGLLKAAADDPTWSPSR
jgi:polyphosphate kinase